MAWGLLRGYGGCVGWDGGWLWGLALLAPSNLLQALPATRVELADLGPPGEATGATFGIFVAVALLMVQLHMVHVLKLAKVGGVRDVHVSPLHPRMVHEFTSWWRRHAPPSRAPSTACSVFSASLRFAHEAPISRGSSCFPSSAASCSDGAQSECTTRACRLSPPGASRLPSRAFWG